MGIANLIGSYKNYTSKIIFYFTIVFIFLFVSFRYEVGADWGNYLFWYEYSSKQSLREIIHGSDPAYNLLNYLSNYLGYSDTILVNTISSFLVLFFLTKTALKLEKYWLVILVYFPYHLLVVSMNYNRQAVAISISLWAFCKLLENKFFQFTFLIFLAALFHQTAITLLLFLPVLLSIKFQLSKVFNIFYIIISLILLLGLLYYFSSSNVNMYLQGNEDMSSKGFFVRWLYHLIPIFLFYKYNFIFKEHRSYPVIRYFSILVLFILPLGMIFSTLSDRFNLYLIFFDLFVICTVFDYLTNKNKIVFLGALILFYTLQMYIWFFYGEWAVKAWIPYKNYISNYLFNNVF